MKRKCKGCDNEFETKHSKHLSCSNECRKKEKLDGISKWKKRNPEKVKASSARYRQKNKAQIKERNAEYDKNRREMQFANKSPKICIVCNSDFKTKIRSKKTCSDECVKQLPKLSRKRFIEKHKNEPEFIINKIISNSSRKKLKAENSSKNGKSIHKSLPYTVKEVKEHIEALWEPWMSWENHGVYKKKEWDDNDSSTWTWQIDHIIPLSDFTIKDMDDENYQKAWALSNIRPLNAKQNVLEGINRTRHKNNK